MKHARDGLTRSGFRSWPAWLPALVLTLVSVVAGCGSEDHFGDDGRSVGAAQDAMVGVAANGCPTVLPTGTGVWVGAHLIMTAAHVVAGAGSIEVVDSTGRVVPALPVVFDAAQDVALLRVGPAAQARRTMRRVMRLTVGPAQVGLLARPSGEGRVAAVRVLRNVVVNTTDPSHTRVSRPGFEIAATIVPGDSGAPLLVDGKVVGLVWARSVTHEGRAWVVAIPEAVAEIVRTGGDRAPTVSTGRCG